MHCYVHSVAYFSFALCERSHLMTSPAQVTPSHGLHNHEEPSGTTPLLVLMAITHLYEIMKQDAAVFVATRVLTSVLFFSPLSRQLQKIRFALPVAMVSTTLFPVSIS